ncbi:bifunctional phosphoribosyl-AMP cyclohydrolase/phosphoribosyl-ATP diphosphatase HisIE [Adhaeribacter aquaticus]|uniref:bifunctional phosphoribosyl-AMP cyclohydrolase/phosphoribosyl-ATP diphosphatase HisIE n=1 Tax=Adhaeribacter aquaticus TaxID=299567 RepID=UPI0003FB8E27|nr:bifunctional phosphoribosyl-AMP cyclohydrolase/phosphoribosyl-ATP diphosphatase HisIE [Adhaeribacter aquaticus]
MNLDFEKAGGLIPAIIQDNTTGQVLMLGFMNQEALERTQQEKVVTFFSRTKNRLWTKGETSNNFLHVVSIQEDCDQDTLLIKVNPDGPTCHTGTISCFTDKPENFSKTGSAAFLEYLEELINDRKKNPQSTSYTNTLFQKGLLKIAQKVGEEAVEVVIDAVAGKKDTMKGEAADLLFHLLVLLAASDMKLSDVIGVLEERHKK